MDKTYQAYDEIFISSLENIVDKSVEHSSKGFSAMVGEEVAISLPVIRQMNLDKVNQIYHQLEEEAVCIYLRGQKELTVQIMLIFPYPQAMNLVDLILGDPPGTNQSLGNMEISALGELGNVTGTYFLNSINTLTGIGARPTPPIVVVDMLGAIMNIIVSTTEAMGENALVFKTSLHHEERGIDLDYWIIPDPTTLEAIAAIARKGSYVE